MSAEDEDEDDDDDDDDDEEELEDEGRIAFLALLLPSQLLNYCLSPSQCSNILECHGYNTAVL